MRLLPLLLVSTTALAHPMGRDEYSLRTGLEVTDKGLRAVVVGEVPLAVVIGDLGKAAGGTRPTPEQVSAYTTKRQQELAAALSLTVDGAPAEAAWTPSKSALNGRAVEGFFVYVVETTLPPSALDGDVSVVVKNTAYDDVATVYSAQVRARDGWTVIESSAPDDWVYDDAARTLSARFVQPPPE